MQGNEVVDALALRGARGVRDRGFRLLVDAFGSAGAVLAAPPGPGARRAAPPRS